MMDTEAAAIRDKERFKRLEEQIIDMLVDKSLDYRHIVRELDCNYKYSSLKRLYGSLAAILLSQSILKGKLANTLS